MKTEYNPTEGTVSVTVGKLPKEGFSHGGKSKDLYHEPKTPYVGEPMKSLKEAEEKKAHGKVVYGSTEPKLAKNIYQRMLQVMDKLKYIQKSAKSPQNAKGLAYTFVTHDSVTKALHMPLVEAGIVCLTSVEEYKSENVIMKSKYGDKENSKVTLKVKVSFVNADDSEDKIEVYSVGVGIDNADKAFGKALSYATKMIYLKNFMLESGDEEDVESSNDECVTDTSSQISIAEDIMLLLPVDRLVKVEEGLLKKYKTKDLKELNFEELKKVISVLEGEKRKLSAKPKGE